MHSNIATYTIFKTFYILLSHHIYSWADIILFLFFWLNVHMSCRHLHQLPPRQHYRAQAPPCEHAYMCMCMCIYTTVSGAAICICICIQGGVQREADI
jgi:hypothetical protein